jgi:hypothetical protein
MGRYRWCACSRVRVADVGLIQAGGKQISVEQNASGAPRPTSASALWLGRALSDLFEARGPLSLVNSRRDRGPVGQIKALAEERLW